MIGYRKSRLISPPPITPPPRPPVIGPSPLQKEYIYSYKPFGCKPPSGY